MAMGVTYRSAQPTVIRSAVSESKALHGAQPWRESGGLLLTSHICSGSRTLPEKAK